MEVHSCQKEKKSVEMLGKKKVKRLTVSQNDEILTYLIQLKRYYLMILIIFFFILIITFHHFFLGLHINEVILRTK